MTASVLVPRAGTDVGSCRDVFIPPTTHLDPQPRAHRGPCRDPHCARLLAEGPVPLRRRMGTG